MPIARLSDSDKETLDTVEYNLDVSLRPDNFSQVIGREREKKTLVMMISASKSKGDPVDHILFHGPPGLGKTSLAHVVAKEMGVTMHVTSGPAIERQGDLAAIVSAMQRNSILFIDEIHRLHRTIEEILYPAMEDRVLDIVVGKGAGAKTVRIDLEPFTIIGATTKIGLLSKPLLDRFGIDFRLDYYSLEEMDELVRQKAQLLGLNMAEDARKIVANRARRTPRIAVKLLKRVRDNALAKGLSHVDAALTLETLALLEIDNAGLDYLDRKILRTIIENFRGGPVGLQALAAALSEEIGTISEVYEPYLLQEGFLERTARGRLVTDKAMRHISTYFGLTV